MSTAFVVGAALAAGAGAAARKKDDIGISYQNLAFPYVAALQKAAENACKALDVDCVEADAVNDTNKELNNVESMLSKGINCLAFEAASLDASVASIQAANKKGVPVVQFNGKASGGDYVTFVGSAQTDSGVKLGQFLEGLYKQLGKDKLRGIYLRGVAGQVTDIARNDGMKNYLQSAPASADKIAFTEQYADYDRGKAQSVTESMLTKDKNYDFIVANNDDMILGALQVVEPVRSRRFLWRRRRPAGGARRHQERRARRDRVSGPGRARRRRRLGLLSGGKGVKLPKELLIPFTLVTRPMSTISSRSPTESTSNSSSRRADRPPRRSLFRRDRRDPIMDVRSIEDVPASPEHQGTVPVWWLFKPREMREETLGGHLELVSEFEVMGGGEVHPHNHPTFEFYYVLSGRG